jgi:NAD(P)-dependent dehydrogenase (short-subunit alcohol dehydrogenase family)
MTIRFDKRAAIVTGAGAGLGRAHALLLAERGAKVVVNDLGGAVDGRGGAQAAADGVVAEIKARGGTAVANYDSVASPEGAKRIVKAATDAFGRLDIVVNNAGILRDKSFGKMEPADFEAVPQVHLFGTYHVTQAAWPILYQQKYGRIVVTTSVAGTNGNFGQTNYGAAKMGLLGLMNCLAIEGAKNNVLVNAISPGAMTRMTEALVPAQRAQYMKADFVAPAVAYLCSEECKATATIISASSAGFSRVHYFETDGVQFDPEKPVTLEMFAEAFPTVADLKAVEPTALGVVSTSERRLKKIGRA